MVKKFKCKIIMLPRRNLAEGKKWRGTEDTAGHMND